MANGSVQYHRGDAPLVQGADTGIHPQFYLKEKENRVKSASEGRPIFDEKEYIKIFIAGDNKTVIDRAVTQNDKERWPDLYSAFKKGIEIPETGTPIRHWPLLTTGKCSELLALHIRTVEDLAALNDNAIKRLGMGGRKLVEQAQLYLENAKSNAPINKLTEENEKLKEDLQAKNVQLNEQQKQINELAAKIDLLINDNLNKENMQD